MATRSETPDLRLFTRVHPTKAAWVSNRDYKTRAGAEAFLAKILNRYDARRRVEYSITQDMFGQYRILAVVKKEKKETR